MKRPIHCRLDESLYLDLQHLASEYHMTLTAVIERLLNDALGANDVKSPIPGILERLDALEAALAARSETDTSKPSRKPRSRPARAAK